MNKIIGVFWVSCLAIAPIHTEAVYARSSKEIAQKAMSSTVLLIREDGEGNISQGSGFFIRNNIIATNYHVFPSRSRGYAKLVKQNNKYSIKEISLVHTNMDLVLLRVVGDTDKIHPLEIGESRKVEVGDEIYVLGNPEGFEGTFSRGLISNIHAASDTIFQITAPVSPGSSGSPVLNDEGKVIGIVFGLFEEGQNLNFIIPAHYLVQMLSRYDQLLLDTSLDKSKEEGGSTLDEEEEIMLERAKRYLLDGDTEAAIAEYEILSGGRSPEAAHAQMAVAALYDSVGRAEEGLIVYYWILAVHESDTETELGAEALWGLSRIYAKLGEMEKSKNAAHEIIRRHPNSKFVKMAEDAGSFK